MSATETFVVDALERGAKTVVQVFAATLITLGVASGWRSFWHAGDVALLAGVVALITALITIPISQALAPPLQVLLRAVFTFGQAALAYLAANTFIDITSVPWLKVLQVALIATLSSVLTSMASRDWGPVKGNPSLVRNSAPTEGPAAP
jgi:Putative lactococcus lactis phage r1t holin